MKVPHFEADPPRKKPYVWPTWITKLIAKEDKCWWKAWYKARHKAEKKPDDPGRAEFFEEWTAKHDILVHNRAQELLDAGWDVRLEDEAAFRLAGERADLQGKPDLVATKNDEAIVNDCKAGRHRDSDHWQVLTYLFAMTVTKVLGTRSVRGEVQYSDGLVPVRPLGPAEKDAIVSAILKVASDIPPEAAPSATECQYCDVAKCPVRYKKADGDASDLF